MLALVYKYMNNNDEALKYFKSSEVKLENMLSNKPDDNRLRFALSISYAGMGMKDKAINELETAFKSDPSWSERRINYERISYLSTIYTLTGDYDNALKQIDQLLSNPTGFSINRLKLDPLYDPLRNLQAYKKIIKKYSVEN